MFVVELTAAPGHSLDELEAASRKKLNACDKKGQPKRSWHGLRPGPRRSFAQARERRRLWWPG
jgi:hypothetical protein